METWDELNQQYSSGPPKQAKVLPKVGVIPDTWANVNAANGTLAPAPLSISKPSDYQPLFGPKLQSIRISPDEAHRIAVKLGLTDYGKTPYVDETFLGKINDTLISAFQVRPAYAPASEADQKQLKAQYESTLLGKWNKKAGIGVGNYISGLSGNSITPETETPTTISDKVVAGLANIAGAATSIGYISKAFGAIAEGNIAVRSLLNTYPKVAKYAFPFLKNAVGFDVYGQLDPTTADRFKRLAEDTLLSVPYTGLGFIKHIAISLPAAFGLGFELAKMNGASDEDAAIQGGLLAVLDAAGRVSQGRHFTTGRAADRYLNQEALDTLNTYSDVKVSAKSTLDELKTAYYSAAHNTHPDKGGNQKDFKSAAKAYEYLIGKTSEFAPERRKTEKPAPPLLQNKTPKETPAALVKPAEVIPPPTQPTAKDVLAKDVFPPEPTPTIKAAMPAIRDQMIEIGKQVDQNLPNSNRQQLIDQETALRDQINRYADANEQSVAKIVAHDKTLAEVKVVPFSDGKWVVSAHANTSTSGFGSPYTFDMPADSKEAAIQQGKQAILDWAQTQLSRSDTNATNKAQLNKIVREIGMASEPEGTTLDIPGLGKIDFGKGTFRPEPDQPVAKPALAAPTTPSIETAPRTFYRGGGEGAAPKGKTAQDIVDYERTDLGNADVKAVPGIDLSAIPAERVQWLTETKAAAQEYGAVEEVSLTNYRIVASDGQGGVLIEKMPAVPRFAGKASEEFKVGDVIETSEGSKQTIREIKGNSIYFTDENGQDYSGFARSTLRNLVNGGSWKKVIGAPEAAPGAIVPITPKLTAPKPATPTPRFAKPKAPAAQDPVVVASKIAVKNAKLPILQEVLVKDGKLYAIDLEVSVALNTTLKDGMYRFVGKNLEPSQIPPEDFPHAPVVNEPPIAKATTAKLAEALKSALISVSPNENRPEITGISITLVKDQNQIEIASTDGFRLYFKRLPAKVTDNATFIISSSKAAKKLHNLLPAIGDMTEISVSKYNFKLAGSNGDITVRPIQGKFPDFKKIYPAYAESYQLDRNAVLNVLKQLAPYADKRGPLVTLKIEAGTITFSTRNTAENLAKELVVPAFKATTVIPAGVANDGVLLMPITGEAVRTYNLDYFADALKALTTPEVHMVAPSANQVGIRPVLFSETTNFITTPPAKVKPPVAPAGFAVISELKNKTLATTPILEIGTLILPNGDVKVDFSRLPHPIEKQNIVKQYLDKGYKNINFVNRQLIATPPTGKTVAPAGIASAGGDTIGDFEDLAGIPDKTPEQLKLYEKVKGLIEKYAQSIGEGYLPRNALGVYYPGSKNIRIKGMNNLSVAAHEITHFLDFAYKISDQLQGIKGYAINGNPIYEKGTASLRKEMTTIYEQYYPGAKHDHPLKKRMLEGFATLLQKYIEQPSVIEAQYPNLVKGFLEAGGAYYKPVMGEIIKDLRGIVAEYQGLNALDKVGARIVNNAVNVNKDTFLSFADKFKTFIADNVYPIEKVAKLGGTHFTKGDPSLWLRQYNNSNTLILNNIKGNRGYWGWRNGELKKLYDYNWKNLINDIQQAKEAEPFGTYLVARREYFQYKELAQLKTLYEMAAAVAQKMRAEGADNMINSTSGISAAAEARAAELAYQKLAGILAKDGFTEQEVTDAYLQNKDRFAEYATKYDALVAADLQFLNDPMVQLIKNEEYRQLASQEGYASFKRSFYDEIVGEEPAQPTRMRLGSTKVSSLLRRTGSQKPIVNPLFSALTNHAEITRKGLRQIVYNRFVDLAPKLPDLFQIVPVKAVPDAQGRLLFPQEHDPNIIMARSNDAKRVAILTDSVVKKTIDDILTHQNIGVFEQLLMGSSRFFTKGTTGLFPGFALTNYAVDQATAIAQTRNNYIPLYDPLTRIFDLLDPKKPEHQYFQEYMIMGGERQTFVGWQDMTPNELFDALGKERAGLLKVVDALNKGANILALPAQWSEILTRATEYLKAREAGKTAIVALEEAGRVTAPFHHVGTWGKGRVGRVYIKSIPFFNPGIQVLAQALETVGTPQGRKRYAFTTLAITASSIAAMAILLATGTEDQKRLYTDINPDELIKYIWLPWVDGKALVKIRVPDQMAVFALVFNMFAADKLLNAHYQVGEYLNAGTSWLPQQFAITEPARALLAWVPQLLKPGILTLAGVKDFPNVQPLESQTLTSRPPGLRFTQSTSPVAKELGKLLNLSPIKIDYLLTGYVGRSSGFLTGKPGIYNPFSQLLRQDYFTSGRKLQQFYNLRDANSQAYYAYTHKLQTFSLGERTAILRERAKLDQVTALLNVYRDLDQEKQPAKVDQYKNKILQTIDKL